LLLLSLTLLLHLLTQLLILLRLNRTLLVNGRAVGALRSFLSPNSAVLLGRLLSLQSPLLLEALGIGTVRCRWGRAQVSSLEVPR